MRYNLENTQISGIVDALGEEYKDLLIEKVLSQFDIYDIDQINVSALIKVDEKAKESLYSDRRKTRRNRMISMLSLLGTIYCFMGLFLLFFYEISRSSRFDPTEMFPFLIILIGIFTLLLSFMVRNMSSVFPLYSKEKDASELNYEIIRAWKQIEGLLIELTPANENLTLDGMIENLASLKLLSSEDVVSIKKMLVLRNQIVHSNKSDNYYLTKEVKSLLNDIYKIIKKLQDFEAR